MPETLTIRDATLNDAAVVAEIYNESIAAGDSTMDVDPKTPEDIRQYILGFSERETYLLAESEGQVLGWGVIKRFADGPEYRFCCETSVYLRRSEVRKGYGSRIKQALIDRCKAYGYHHLVARIWATNAGSIAYNKKYGYEMVGIQKEIGHIHGQWKDIAVMQLVLDDVPSNK